MTRTDSGGILGLARNFFFAAMSGGSAALLLIVLVIAGRMLGAESYGRFSFALALATIGEAVMDFGLHQVTIRTIARERDRAGSVFRNSLSLKFLPSIVTVAALALVARWLRPEPDVRLACFLLAISAVMRSYVLTVRGVLQGLEEFAWDTVVIMLDRILLLAASAWVLFHGGTHVGLAWAFVIGRTLAMTAALTIAGIRVSHPRPAFDRDVWRELPARALPIGAFLLALNLYSYVDTVMLGVLATDAETGLYNFAYRIYEGLTYAPAVLSAVLTPRLSRHFVENRRQYAMLARQGLLVSTGIAVAAALVTWLLAAPAVIFLFGAQFANAAPTLRILALGLVLVFPIWILHAVAISATAERVLLKTTGIGVLVNVAANLILIPMAGRNGAAVATVLGEAVSLLILLRGLRRELNPDAA